MTAIFIRLFALACLFAAGSIVGEQRSTWQWWAFGALWSLLLAIDLKERK